MANFMTFLTSTEVQAFMNLVWFISGLVTLILVILDRRARKRGEEEVQVFVADEADASRLKYCGFTLQKDLSAKELRGVVGGRNPSRMPLDLTDVPLRPKGPVVTVKLPTAQFDAIEELAEK